MSPFDKALDAIERLKVFCPTGPGGGVDPTCGSGGGSGGVISEPISVDSLRDQLEVDEYGNLAGTKDVGAIKVKAYRIGDVKNSEKQRGGVFFAGDKESASQYATLHEGSQVKEYTVSFKNALLAGHQNDITKKYFKKTYGEMMNAIVYQNRGEPAHVASSKFDKKLLGALKKDGYDGLILLRPAPPANSEIALIGKLDSRVES